MRITFLGHAAFLIQTAGKKIVTDPYSSEIGYESVGVRADFVTISHPNPKWHSCLDNIAGDFELIDGLHILQNSARRGEIEFGSVLAYERENEGENEGENAMVWMESEGVRVLHTGDCGVLPDDETLEKCGRVDVLLALAGGFPTLELDDVMILIEKLSPQIVIPMHYAVPGLAMKALEVEELAARFDESQVVRNAGSSFDFLWNLGLENSNSQKMKGASHFKSKLHILRPERARNSISTTGERA